MNFTEKYFTCYILLIEQKTQSKIHGGFVTFYPIHFSKFKCGTYWGYPKYCYSKLGRKDYTIKLKRNSVMRLPNYLDIEENVVIWSFLRLLWHCCYIWGYLLKPTFKFINNSLKDVVPLFCLNTFRKTKTYLFSSSKNTFGHRSYHTV